MSQTSARQRFLEATRLHRDGDHPAALELFDGLISERPDAAQLHYHRGRCLLQLDAYDDAIAAFDRAIALAPDHVPLLITRAQLGGDESFDPLPLLQRARTLEPDNSEVLMRIAEHDLMLADHEEDPARRDAALALLERSLELDPSRAETWACRAAWHQGRAMAAENPANPVRDLYGMTLDGDALEAALRDYTRASELEPGGRHDHRCARLAEQLGRYELAVEHYDRILAQLPPDAPQREYLQSERDRCAGGEAGARNAIAAQLSQLGESGSAERSLQDDMAHALVEGMAAMVQQGSDPASAMQTLAGDGSPEDLIATNIAFQIFNYAREPDPDLAEVSADDFPGYQRNHARSCEKTLLPLGYRKLADVEARGLAATLGSRVLVRVFVHPEHGSAAAFAIKPHWPGLLSFLLMRLTGQWKTSRMLECQTRFEDGVFMSTRVAGPDPFDNSSEARIQFEKMPPKSSAKQVALRHAERVLERMKQGHQPIVPDSVEAIDAQWAESTRVKNACRLRMGYISDAELRNLLGKQHDRLAERVRQRLAALTGAA